MAKNLFEQEPWQRRGEGDQQAASLTTRVVALEADQSKVFRYFSAVGKLNNQAVTSGLTPAVDFDTIIREDVALFDNTANTWTIPRAGLWELMLHVTWIHTDNTCVDCSAIWDVDGSFFEGTRDQRTSGGNGVGSISWITLGLSASQVVTPRAFISATSPSILGNANTSRYTRAHIRRIGPL